MYTGHRNGRHRAYHYSKDITVHDFADSIPGIFSGSRQRKSEKLKHINKTVLVDVKMAEAEDVAWFDKDLDDFDITIDNELGTDGAINDSVKRTSGRKRNNTVHEDVSGVVYPVDVWFQLSRFIDPESVATFALLCRGTNAVAHTVQFWKRLCLRNYNEEVDIPEDLQLESLDRMHGLRARTIKMLYYVHPPLVARTQTSVPFENEPHCLVGQRCLLSWHKKVKNVWKFYFKFRKGDSIDLSSNERRSLKSRDFRKWHQDLYYNPDNHTSIIEVTCPGYASLPIVMGLILNGVYLNVSSGSMRYHRLKLVLDTNYRLTTSKNQMSMIELILDPVLEVRVFPWWHPEFTVNTDSK